MSISRTTTRNILKLFIWGVLILFISVYAISRSLNYAKGPHIYIQYPPDYAATSSPAIDIYGYASRINSITLNGRSLTIDEFGNFRETVLIFPGTNYFTLNVQDQFGRKAEQQLRIYGEALE